MSPSLMSFVLVKNVEIPHVTAVGYRRLAVNDQLARLECWPKLDQFAIGRLPARFEC
jgi:hypothetical protein